jgi:hypothetical protein
MSDSVSLTPGHYPGGPEQDAALANRRAFHAWLRESPDPSALAYRHAVEVERRAKRERAAARTRARAAFKKARAGGTA